jgi:hypothetical protein
MDLTDQESKEFWPLYEGYQKDLEHLNRYLSGPINEYAEAQKNIKEKDAEPSINFQNGSGANKVEGDMTLHGLLTG